MKKPFTRLLSVFLVVVLFVGMMEISAMAASYTPGTYEVSHSKGVNIRSTSSTSGTIKGAAAKGTTFEVSKVSGTWGYTSSVKASNGKTVSGWISLAYCKQIKTSTNTTEKTTITISGSPISVTLGSGQHITGTVKSTGSKLKSITVTVMNSAGTKTIANLTKTVNVNTYSYTLKNSTLDNAMVLSNIPSAGTYKLKIIAKTADGKSATKSFTITVTKPVVTTPSSSTESTATSKSKTLSINWNLIKKTGNQSVSGPCFCYALAYARDIIDGKTHYWKEYDVNGGRYGQCSAYASISLANFGRNAPSNKATALKNIYELVKSGKPVVINVTGGRSSGEHYVCVVGYTNVTNTSKLTESNFLIIDSVQGTTKSSTENLGTIGYKLKYSKGSSGSYGYHYYYPLS